MSEDCAGFDEMSKYPLFEALHKRRSRRIGFVGASVIHPSQVAILNEEFRPSAAEVDHAGRVVAAYDKALAEGIGAVTVDGKMIDVPIVERAKLLLDRRQRIQSIEALAQLQALHRGVEGGHGAGPGEAGEHQGRDDDGRPVDEGKDEERDGVVESGASDDAVSGDAAADTGELDGCEDGSDAE